MAFLSDVFHPLVTPLTTYTYSTRDTGAETVSAADKERLPPGGLSLRHGFPEWFDTTRDGASNKDTVADQDDQQKQDMAGATTQCRVRQWPLTVEVLQYIRIVFGAELILDSVPLEAAANPGAWHAWRSYRSKTLGGRASPASTLPSNASDAPTERSTSPQQQPAGARRPGEWNWQGVWEDRVKKSIQASASEHMLYGGDNREVICFSKTDPETMNQALPSWKDAALA